MSLFLFLVTVSFADEANETESNGASDELMAKLTWAKSAQYKIEQAINQCKLLEKSKGFSERLLSNKLKNKLLEKGSIQAEDISRKDKTELLKLKTLPAEVTISDIYPVIEKEAQINVVSASEDRLIEATVDKNFIQAVLKNGEFERKNLTEEHAKGVKELIEKEVPEKITLKDLAEAVVNLDKISQEELTDSLRKKKGWEMKK